MITPKYTTLEQSKRLKEKGFDIPCDGRYYWDFSEYKFSPQGAIKWSKNEDSYPAPEQHVVIYWILEKYNIWIEVKYMDDVLKFGYIITTIKSNTEQSEVYNFVSPQEAYSAAFDYIIQNNLI